MGSAKTNSMTTEEGPPLPLHVEETVATIAALPRCALSRGPGAPKSSIQSDARDRAARHADREYGRHRRLDHPQSRSAQFGRAALDPFPFPLLSAAVSTVGFYLAAMILISQRHDDEMATRGEQMTLELAILGEQKSAKIISLLEEFRRNDPNQGDDRDEVAEALAKPADAQVVLDAIRAGEGAEESG